MSILVSLLGGLSGKAYDDLHDNTLLHKFKNATLMEYLKGLHFITFTTVSIDDPLFFIVSYVANICNYVGNKDAFSEAYEYSLLYSFIILFGIIDYAKIQPNSIIDILLLVAMCITMFLEPVIMRHFLQNSEFSYVKLIFRIIFLVCSFVSYMLGTSKTAKYLFSYCMGYFIISVLVQGYSWIITKLTKDDDKQDDDKQDDDKQDDDITDDVIKENA